jgi:hypothetical protein
MVPLAPEAQFRITVTSRFQSALIEIRRIFSVSLGTLSANIPVFFDIFFTVLLLPLPKIITSFLRVFVWHDESPFR